MHEIVVLVATMTKFQDFPGSPNDIGSDTSPPVKFAASKPPLRECSGGRLYSAF